jgi:tetratricopeptide (TPR) repeat protein
MKNKYVAGFLSLFFGFFGVHRFYLGQRFLGVVYFIMGIASIMVSAAADVPAALIPGVLAFVDAMVLLFMPRRDFDRKYNKEYDYEYGYGQSYEREREAYPASHRPKHQTYRPSFQALKRSGIKHFRRHRYERAAEDFEQALSLQPDSVPMLYNLAAVYSMLRDEDRAYYYLEEAVESGFDKYDKIHTHDALTYLRSLPSFNAFVDNGYRRPNAALPPAEPEGLQELPPLETSKGVPASEDGEEALPSSDLLEQIVELGKLRERGILTDEEFVEQKRKMLEQ